MAFVSANSHDGSEFISGLALELLDELRIRMMECRLVLSALPDEADMNFDELDVELHTAQEAATRAYAAASVVHQGARLDPRWGNGWSRPKAIFARHQAAVRDGAPKVDPKPALGDRVERSLWQLPGMHNVDRAPDARPKCTGTVRTTKRPCTAGAVYLGSGLFAAHCYSHATPAERAQCRAHHDFVDTFQSTAYTDLLERQREVGERLSVQWLQDRDSRGKWVDEVSSADRADR
ncbi:hypothetical protein B5P44_18635 [Mycobacterium sp. CBMA 213]|nr:hypothetical protein [Mycolicibacterium sp. CBMA 213]